MIRGAEALGARLERMKERLYRGAEETVAEAAQAVCAEAAARAPVETGRLRSSIHASAEGVTAAVRCGCPYGAAVELGTSRQSARPFMQPAADTERANGSSCVGEGCAGGRKGEASVCARKDRRGALRFLLCCGGDVDGEARGCS